MIRMDGGMPFLLQYEHVAWYEDGVVTILDRRCYPIETRFVTCRSHTEVADAIRDMVTQSAGPYTAVGMGMALAAYEARNLPAGEIIPFLEKASQTLGNARPTQANRYLLITQRCVKVAREALASGLDPVQAIVTDTVDSMNRRYASMQKLGDQLADLISDGGTILTQCYGETIIGTLIRAMKRKGKTFRACCAETRPYLQGARLTASCFADSGIDTTLLTDNMIAYAMSTGMIDVFTSAADTVCCDGTIANKVGSLQIAILAKHYGIPYYVTGRPDQGKETGKDIVVEMREPDQVLSFMGIKTTVPGVKAIYPAFDIVPAHLISGIVTDRGVYVPGAIGSYFQNGNQQFY